MNSEGNPCRSTLLNYVDTGFVTLPKFQRGYVWSREQVRKLFTSLYRKHPVGGLILWTTGSEGAQHRGSGVLPPGVVNLLLDGQQRVTSIYGVVRGAAPKFFDGNPQAFTGLYFNLNTEDFEFYQPIKMRGDSLWIDVTNFMQKGNDGIGTYYRTFFNDPDHSPNAESYINKLNRLLAISATEIPEQAITGNRSLDEIVDIFNEVNTGGTKLSKGDLALARICADWPEARDIMKEAIGQWTTAGYDFTLDWLLRSVNTVLTNNAEFRSLHDRGSEEVKGSLTRTRRHIDTWLNQVGGRLGLDHDRVLFGRYAFPVLARYSETHPGSMSAETTDKLLFWFAQSGMWGRFSSASETAINQDLRTIEGDGDPIDALLETLRLWRGSLQVEPANDFATLGARFYPVLYMLTRMGEAKDWCSGLPLKKNLHGHMSQLEVHHIFPKSRLYSKDFGRKHVNALANFCFLTKECNLLISNRLPEEYFPEIEREHPGVLESQWIPRDPELWKIENYLRFLAARRELLAAATNQLMRNLLHGDERWLAGPANITPPESETAVLGGTVNQNEEEEIEAINAWVVENSLPPGQVAFMHIDPDTRQELAVFDLAWPNGLQEGLTQPVVILLDEDAAVQSLASDAGFRCFTSAERFKTYVEREIVGAQTYAAR